MLSSESKIKADCEYLFTWLFTNMLIKKMWDFVVFCEFM